VLESDALRVVIDKQTGCVTSLYDKHSKFETLAEGACGNELQASEILQRNTMPGISIPVLSIERRRY